MPKSSKNTKNKVSFSAANPLENGETYIFLLADVLVEGRVPDVSLDRALHHSASIVVFNVAFPARFRQVRLLCEALLSEVLNGVVVCVGKEVVELFGLCVILELVHEARTVPFDLLLSRDRQEDDLCELLPVEGSEDAPAQDLRLLPLLLLYDDHGLVDAVHH